MPLRSSDPLRLGRYELTGRLGEGGMGTVFLARDEAGTPVAIKVMRAEFAHDEEVRARFRSEVTRARQVPSFSTAAVLDADPEHDPPYLVIEYVDGPSLTTVVRQDGPMSGSELHTLAVGIATALSAIHGAGVIHRDLKPGNVLLARGGLKVIDFGIARAFEATSRHTRTDHMVGTVAYMAPERFDAEGDRAVTAAADIFAWGVVVAYAATGRTPFAADSSATTAMRILTQPPKLDGLAEPLRGLVAAALAKEPEDRPSAPDLLHHLVTGTTPNERGITPGARDITPENAAPDQRTPAGFVPATVDTVRVRRHQRWPRPAMAAAGTAVAVLAAAALGIGIRNAGADDTGAAPETASPADAIPGPDRRVLIRISELGRNLSLDRHDYEVTAADSAGTDAQFVLEPTGTDFLIRSLRGDGHPSDEPTCLGVKLEPDTGFWLQAASCRPSKATLFTIARTDDADADAATFQVFSQEYGHILWDAEGKKMSVDQMGGYPPPTTYTFVDSGPAQK